MRVRSGNDRRAPKREATIQSMALSRRSFLRGVGATVALPWMPSVTGDRQSTPPVRAAWIYFPNGVSEGSFLPRRASRDGRLEHLHPTMAPLERHREHLVIARNLWTPLGNNHGAGTATWLTGGDWDELTLDPGGVSVDQVAARELGRDCVAPALSLRTLGVGNFATDVARNSISWSARGRPVFRETDPRAVFQRLYGAGVDGDASLLDDLVDQAASLRARASRADQERLDAYLDAVRELERRLEFVHREATSRRLAAATDFGFEFDPTRPIETVPENHGDYVDLLFDLMALALWSGASRVASFMLDHGQSNRPATFLPGVQGTWHALSHWKDASGRTDDDDGVTKWSDVGSKRAMYDAVVTWHHERVARFLDRMRSLPEGEGSLLDQTLVVYGSSIEDGYDHGEYDLPIVLAGAAGGSVRTGRILDPGGPTDLARLHLATLRALGSGAARFAAATDALPLA